MKAPYYDLTVMQSHNLHVLLVNKAPNKSKTFRRQSDNAKIVCYLKDFLPISNFDPRGIAKVLGGRHVPLIPRADRFEGMTDDEYDAADKQIILRFFRTYVNKQPHTLTNSAEDVLLELKSYFGIQEARLLHHRISNADIMEVMVAAQAIAQQPDDNRMPAAVNPSAAIHNPGSAPLAAAHAPPSIHNTKEDNEDDDSESTKINQTSDVEPEESDKENREQQQQQQQPKSAAPRRSDDERTADASKAMPSWDHHGERPFGMMREVPKHCKTAKDVYRTFPANHLVAGTISIRHPDRLTVIPDLVLGTLVPSETLEPHWDGYLPSRQGTCYFGKKESDFLWLGMTVRQLLEFANKAEREWVSFRLPLYISIVYTTNPAYQYVGPFPQSGLRGCAYFSQLHGPVLPDEVWEGLPNEDGTYTWKKIVQRYDNIY